MPKTIFAHGLAVTMNSKYQLIEDAAVVTEADKIIFVGAFDTYKDQIAETDSVIDCTGQLILPGFIDTHAHAGHCMNRALGWDTRSRWMGYMTNIYHFNSTPDYWYWEGRLASLERLKAGITCGVNVLTNAGRCDDPRIAVAQADAYATTGVRQILAIGPSNPPYPRAFGQWRDDDQGGHFERVELSFDEVMQKAEEAIELTHHSHNGLIEAFIAPFVMVTSVQPSGPTPADMAVRLTEHDRKMMKAVREIAKRQKTRIHTEAFGGMIRMAAQSEDALLGPDVHVQHCKGIGIDEALILAETHTNVTTSPGWSQIFNRCPVPTLMGLGVNVAISTDGTSPGIPYDLIQAARNLAMITQGAERDFFYLPCGKLLSMITIDAAKAIGRENDLGSLETGKQADIITVDLQKPHLTPNFLPIHKLMLYGNASDVDTVMVQGKLRIVKRQVLDIDEAEVLKEATEESLRTIRRAGYEKLLEPSDTFWTGYRNLVFEERLA